MPPQSKGHTGDGPKGMTMPNDVLPTVRAMSDSAFHRFQRAMWAVCVVVYLAVFLGGIQAGGSELMAVARAVGFTLVAEVSTSTESSLNAGSGTLCSYFRFSGPPYSYNRTAFTSPSKSE